MSTSTSRVRSVQEKLTNTKKPAKMAKPQTVNTSKPQGAKDTIDSIFGELKEKQRIAELKKQMEEEKKQRIMEEKKSHKKIRRTEEGYRIYTLEELGLDKNKYGGNTPLCPFDCDCCH